MLLHMAVWRKKPEIVAALLECGADGRIKDTMGRTPLDVARTSRLAGFSAAA